MKDCLSADTEHTEVSAQSKNVCVIVFAKYPAHHQAKTRLQPALGVAGAAQMAKRLLLHSVDNALASNFDVELCVSPASTDPCWQALHLSKSLCWSTQVKGDLGSRLWAASQVALAHYRKVVLIGADCPSLTAERIKTAVQQLDQYDAVMIPATDGGYVLLGFKKAHQSLFLGVRWSTESVAADTEQRMAALGWTVSLLAPLHDIDEPEDLKHLPVGWLNPATHLDVNNNANNNTITNASAYPT